MESRVKRSRELRGTGEGKAYPKLLGKHAHRRIAEAILGRPLKRARSSTTSTATSSTTIPQILRYFRHSRSIARYTVSGRRKAGDENEYFQKSGRRSPYGNGLGTGKTLVSIAAAGALYNAGRIKRALVVAPLSVAGVWDEEFGKFAAFGYTLAVLKGSGDKKVSTLRHMTGDAQQVVNRHGGLKRSWQYGVLISSLLTKVTKSSRTISRHPRRCTGWTRRRSTDCS